MHRLSLPRGQETWSIRCVALVVAEEVFEGTAKGWHAHKSDWAAHLQTIGAHTSITRADFSLAMGLPHAV